MAQNWPPSEYDFPALTMLSCHLIEEEVEELRYTDLEEIMQEIRENGWESIKKHSNSYAIIQLDKHDSKDMQKKKIPIAFQKLC